jgi:hypothetical protein
MRRLERLDWHAPHLRGETEELRDVALVGGGCMSGGVAIQPEIFEKLAELLRHRANAGAIHSSRARNARSEVAVLRSSRFSRRRPSAGSGGGMIPNVMFVGW